METAQPEKERVDSLLLLSGSVGFRWWNSLGAILIPEGQTQKRMGEASVLFWWHAPPGRCSWVWWLAPHRCCNALQGPTEKQKRLNGLASVWQVCIAFQGCRRFCTKRSQERLKRPQDQSPFRWSFWCLGLGIDHYFAPLAFCCG